MRGSVKKIGSGIIALVLFVVLFGVHFKQWLVYGFALLVLFYLSGCFLPDRDQESRADQVQELQVSENPLSVLQIASKNAIFDPDRQIREMKYIKLQTTAASLIGSVSKLLVENRRLYIHDRTGNQIQVFAEDGKHLLCLRAEGRGPHEYHRIHDFVVDADSILIYDNLSSKILFFTLQGDFIKYKPAPCTFKEFARVSPGKYVYATRNSDNVVDPGIDGFALAFGTVDTLIAKASRNNTLLANWNMVANNTLARVGEEIYFTPFLSDTIFAMQSNGTLHARYKLRFPDQLPADYFKRTDESHFENFVRKHAYLYFMGDVQENTQYIYFRFFADNYYRYALYDKHSKGSVWFDGYTHPVNYLGYAHPIAVYQDYFVALLDPQALLEHKTAQDIENQIGPLAETDNPVVIFFRFKS